MRLINTTTFTFEGFKVNSNGVPPYAIVSHCWEGEQEISFRDFNELEEGRGITQKRGFHKVWKACERARNEDPPLRYCWVDTCCIDRLNLGETDRSINSMYAWYRNSAICYVYLHDLQDGGDLESQLPECKYFTRGWTLQELVAPQRMMFFDAKWKPRGTKIELRGLLSRITNISEHVLEDGRNVHKECVARRMSWAANRQTTLVEDQAYCLLGIFNLQIQTFFEGMPFFYLVLEIIQKINDRSVFAWKSSSNETYRGLLPCSPKEYAHCSRYNHVPAAEEMANLYQYMAGGLRFTGNLPIIAREQKKSYWLDLHCWDWDNPSDEAGRVPVRIGIALHRAPNGEFVRANPQNMDNLKEHGMAENFTSYYPHMMKNIKEAGIIDRIKASCPQVMDTLIEHGIVPEPSPLFPEYPKDVWFYVAAKIEDKSYIEEQFYQSLQVCLPKSAVITAVEPKWAWDPSYNLIMPGKRNSCVACINFNMEDASGQGEHRFVLSFGSLTCYSFGNLLGHLSRFKDLPRDVSTLPRRRKGEVLPLTLMKWFLGCISGPKIMVLQS